MYTPANTCAFHPFICSRILPILTAQGREKENGRREIGGGEKRGEGGFSFCPPTFFSFGRRRACLRTADYFDDSTASPPLLVFVPSFLVTLPNFARANILLQRAMTSVAYPRVLSDP